MNPDNHWLYVRSLFFCHTGGLKPIQWSTAIETYLRRSVVGIFRRSDSKVRRTQLVRNERWKWWKIDGITRERTKGRDVLCAKMDKRQKLMVKKGEISKIDSMNNEQFIKLCQCIEWNKQNSINLYAVGTDFIVSILFCFCFVSVLKTK